MTTIYLVARYAKDVEAVELLAEHGDSCIEYRKHGRTFRAENWFHRDRSWFYDLEAAMSASRCNREQWVAEKVAELSELTSLPPVGNSLEARA